MAMLCELGRTCLGALCCWQSKLFIDSYASCYDADQQGER